MMGVYLNGLLSYIFGTIEPYFKRLPRSSGNSSVGNLYLGGFESGLKLATEINTYPLEGG